MLDFAEAGHWERALILLLSCARLVRVQNLVLGTAALRSSEILLGAVPALPAVVPWGKSGVFGRLFWDSTPPNLEFRIEKKTPERQ